MDKIFVRIEGVDGSISRGIGNEKWMQVSNVEFEISREVEFKDVTERLLPDHSHPDISKIVITKPLCPATPSIFASICLLKKRKFELEIVHNKGESFGETTLSEVLGTGITRYESEICFVNASSLSASAGHPDETIVVTVPSLKATYTPANLAETPTGSSSFGYNFQMSRLI
jgi:type VI protein secretion system component Hcp